jgi:phospholipid transport system substrate-binding protein
MLRLPLTIAALALCALIAVPGQRAEAAKAECPAAAFVQRMGDQALTSRVRALLQQNFDVKSIGRFVMGPAWKDATDAQKSEYMKLFEDMIVRTYTRRFADYSGQSFAVTGCAPLAGSGHDSLVKSKILQNGGPPVMVDWRVRAKDGGTKVVDVVVEDISMSMTQRSDFSAVVQSGGVDGLIKSLQQRTGQK